MYPLRLKNEAKKVDSSSPPAMFPKRKQRAGGVKTLRNKLRDVVFETNHRSGCARHDSAGNS